MLGCLAAAAVCITCCSVLSVLLIKVLFLGSTVRMLGSLTGYLAAFFCSLLQVSYEFLYLLIFHCCAFAMERNWTGSVGFSN